MEHFVIAMIFILKNIVNYLGSKRSRIYFSSRAVTYKAKGSLLIYLKVTASAEVSRSNVKNCHAI